MEPTPAEMQELATLAEKAWPHPTKERFAQLAHRCVPWLLATLARQDAQIEMLRTAKPKREKVA